MTYDVDYFIAKFEAIPENKWTTREYIDENGRCCALGHCGQRQGCYGFTEEAEYLRHIFYKYYYTGIVSVNDNFIGSSIESPKQRILAALYDIKNITK